MTRESLPYTIQVTDARKWLTVGKALSLTYAIDFAQRVYERWSRVRVVRNRHVEWEAGGQ